MVFVFFCFCHPVLKVEVKQIKSIKISVLINLCFSELCTFPSSQKRDKKQIE